MRDEVRTMVGRFVEVYAECPLEVCEQHDVKGLYRKARAGELKQFTGIDDPYEEPLIPEVIVSTDRETVEDSAGRVIAKLEELGGAAPIGPPARGPQALHRLSTLCEIRVPLDKEIYRLAKGFQLKRVSSKDALHLACAQSVRSRLFLTCDDEIIRRAGRLNLDMTVINPVEYVREVGNR